VQEAVVDKRKIMVVNHRSTEKLTPRNRHLVGILEERAKEPRPLHLLVRINKAKYLGREYTQRTRSFLYAALGATIASMVGLQRLRFYENGIVSLNLPPSPQVVGARATRTTHPQFLNGFAELLRLVTGKAFAVENQFFWKTKTDVVQLIGDACCGDLIRYATSCTRTWEMTRQHPHCGVCSQCIDRRFAILAAGQEASDPAEGYKVDLFGERTDNNARTMLAAYLETANVIEQMDVLQFFARFGEASRILRHLGDSPDATAIQVFNLHRRHSKQVTGVIDAAFGKYGRAIRKRSLPSSCLLQLVYDSSSAAAGRSVSAPTPHQVAAHGEVPHNYILKKGRYWVIRFDGQEEKVYTPDIGFYYLQMLMLSPGSWFSASQLDCDLRRHTKMRTRSASHSVDAIYTLSTADSPGDETLDSEACASYTTRLAEIIEARARLKESDSPTRLDEIEELDKEKMRITSLLRKGHGLHGRKRRLGDDRNRVRNRVCIAIRRALNQVKEYDTHLAEHLKKPVLNLGHTISYVPRDGVFWSSSCDSVS
jgi:hypothetical protein